MGMLLIEPTLLDFLKAHLSGQLDQGRPTAQATADKLLKVWDDQVKAFDRQVYQKLRTQLSEKEKRKLLDDCRFVLRTTLLIQRAVEDPYFPTSRYAQHIPSAISKFKEWVSLLEDPTTADEAEAFFKKAGLLE